MCSTRILFMFYRELYSIIDCYLSVNSIAVRLMVLMFLSCGEWYTQALGLKERQAVCLFCMTYHMGFYYFDQSNKASLEHFNNWLTIIVPINVLIFISLIRSSAREVAIINAQIEKLQRGAENEALVKTLLYKQIMFSQLFVVLWIYVIGESICLILYAYRAQWAIIMGIFEASLTMVFGSIVYIFSCRHERSIFFHMIPSSHMGTGSFLEDSELLNHQRVHPDWYGAALVSYCS